MIYYLSNYAAFWQTVTVIYDVGEVILKFIYHTAAFSGLLVQSELQIMIRIVGNFPDFRGKGKNLKEHPRHFRRACKGKIADSPQYKEAASLGRQFRFPHVYPASVVAGDHSALLGYLCERARFTCITTRQFAATVTGSQLLTSERQSDITSNTSCFLDVCMSKGRERSWLGSFTRAQWWGIITPEVNLQKREYYRELSKRVNGAAVKSVKLASRDSPSSAPDGKFGTTHCQPAFMFPTSRSTSCARTGQSTSSLPSVIVGMVWNGAPPPESVNAKWGHSDSGWDLRNRRVGALGRLQVHLCLYSAITMHYASQWQMKQQTPPSKRSEEEVLYAYMRMSVYVEKIPGKFQVRKDHCMELRRLKG
ncbi:hypothetical protein BGY98DRAFT_937611 [Russula aff. rugulosa BPL654]|nr:hypothetical protein BGY98DRAFT_937611 [Russula aff. rugulosa BPL654]